MEELPINKVLEKNKNIKVVVEYYRNKEGKLVKRTARYKVTTVIRKIKKSVWERSQWSKFGQAVDDKIYKPLYGEEFTIDLLGRKNCDENNTTTHGEHIKDYSEAENKNKTIFCRNCGKKGHWTMKCPSKKKEKQPTTDPKKLSAPKKKGVYVPPHLRGDNQENRRVNQSYTLMISNFPEDIQEDDVKYFLEYAGKISRMHMVKNRETKKFSGVVYVDFYFRDEAEQSLQEIDGYAYDRMILRAQWAKNKKK
jgi:translation initiation factor 3 subunit G